MPGPVPHHDHLRGCFRASQPTGRSDGPCHNPPQPKAAPGHTLQSAFDCNIAVTDFPLFLTWVFLLCLSLPFLLVPSPHLSPSLCSCQGQGGRMGTQGALPETCPRRGCRASQTRHQTESLRTSQACRELPAPGPRSSTAPHRALQEGTRAGQHKPLAQPLWACPRGSLYPTAAEPQLPARQATAREPAHEMPAPHHAGAPAAPAKRARPHTIPSRPPTGNVL